ncbi:hypothetical protein ACFL5V_13560, partial [Fibrobacterota bacterium]
SLVREYTQEIPHTFGASIRLDKLIHGSLRSDDKGLVTEVIFQSDQSVHFSPPGFVFFVPKMFVRIASVRREKGELFGYVIGRPMNMPSKFCAVRYNLTTCAKTSIKNYNLSPKEYARKLKNVNYFGFVK